MKTILFLLILSSCTQKYVSYDLIRKVQFGHDKYQRPVVNRAVKVEGSDRLKSCFNQWLFSSNAEQRKNEAIPLIVRSLCPSHDYLVNTDVEETWWTTIIFTRACAEIRTFCGTVR